MESRLIRLTFWHSQTCTVRVLMTVLCLTVLDLGQLCIADARMVPYSWKLFSVPEPLVYVLVRRKGFAAKSFPLNKVRTPEYGIQGSLLTLSAWKHSSHYLLADTWIWLTYFSLQGSGLGSSLCPEVSLLVTCMARSFISYVNSLWPF